MTEKDFKLERLKDGSFRLTRTDAKEDQHTHLMSKSLAKVIVNNVCNKKIPLNSRNYTLERV